MTGRKGYSSQVQDQYMVRFPDGMRQMIKEEATQNGRSMNAEIIFRLKHAYGVAAATEGQIGVGSSAAASSNNVALAGGASITNG